MKTRQFKRFILRHLWISRTEFHKLRLRFICYLCLQNNPGYQYKYSTIQYFVVGRLWAVGYGHAVSVRWCLHNKWSLSLTCEKNGETGKRHFCLSVLLIMLISQTSRDRVDGWGRIVKLNSIQAYSALFGVSLWPRWQVSQYQWWAGVGVAGWRRNGRMVV